jgi:hypothetical protein
MNLDPMEHILSGGKTSIINDSLLMNIAALQLKMTFENRIADITARKTLLRSNIDEAIIEVDKPIEQLEIQETQKANIITEQNIEEINKILEQ